jgi:hypothetical protein
MIWEDQGGQLPYSHVVVDITGSMSHPQMIPNYSGTEVFSRLDYALSLLWLLLRNKAITPETKIYPVGDYRNQDLSRFVSANFIFSPQGNIDSKSKQFWELFFYPTSAGPMSPTIQLPKTKTLLISDDLSIQQGSYLSTSGNRQQQKLSKKIKCDYIAWEERGGSQWDQHEGYIDVGQNNEIKLVMDYVLKHGGEAAVNKEIKASPKMSKVMAGVGPADTIAMMKNHGSYITVHKSHLTDDTYLYDDQGVQRILPKWALNSKGPSHSEAQRIQRR